MLLKSGCVGVVDDVRRIYRALGESLAKSGALPSARLVFFFSHAGLQSFLRSPSPLLIARYILTVNAHSWVALYAGIGRVSLSYIRKQLIRY